MLLENEITIVYYSGDTWVGGPEVWGILRESPYIYYEEGILPGGLWSAPESQWGLIDEAVHISTPAVFLLSENQKSKNLRVIDQKHVRIVHIALEKPRGPLTGKHIAVVRPYPEALTYAYELEHYGARALPLPVLFFKPTPGPELERAVNEHWDYIVFTSKRGVQALETLYPASVLKKLFHSSHIVAIGPETARKLEVYVDKILLPSQYSQEGLIELFQGMAHPGERVLLLRTQGRQLLKNALEHMNLICENIEIYTMEPTHRDKLELMLPYLKSCTDILFTSPRLVDAFLTLYGEDGRSFMEQAHIIAIGHVTAKRLEKLGFSNILTPSEYTGEGLLQALLHHVSSFSTLHDGGLI